MLDTDLARATELYDLIPSKVLDIAVAAAPAQLLDLNRLDAGGGNFVSLAGKRVRFRAITAGITFLAAEAAGLTAGGVGVTLPVNTDSQRYFIPPAAKESATTPAVVRALPLTVVSTGAATLRIFYDGP